MAIPAYIVLSRAADGTALTNVPWFTWCHSPTGFEFGYGGSGPADLALNVLIAFGVNPDDAWRLHQEFKRDFIARADQESGCHIATVLVEDWLKERGIAVDMGKIALHHVAGPVGKEARYGRWSYGFSLNGVRNVSKCAQVETK